MKEIIYIQAGTSANYIGTHFWNTQEDYLGDDGVQVEHDSDSAMYDWDVSFREGLGPSVRCFYALFSLWSDETWHFQGQPTVCPRLLIFDKKGVLPANSP